MNRKMIRFALAGILRRLDEQGIRRRGLPRKQPETKSSASNPASPNMPKPLANRRNICRRLKGTCQPPLECGLSMFTVYSLRV